MDYIENFLREHSWLLPKAYPDINNPEDKKYLFELFQEKFSIKEQNNTKIGYHIGNINLPAESLEDRNWYFGNKTGYLGTGYYFYGDLKNAKEDARTLNKNKILSIDLSSYKLFRSSSPEKFYDTLAELTQQIGLAAPNISDEDISTGNIEDSLDEIAEIVQKDLKLPLDNSKTKSIVIDFIKDIRDKNSGTLLSNRLLVPLGYEGINNINTPLDNFGVGSIIFDIKDKTTYPVDN